MRFLLVSAVDGSKKDIDIPPEMITESLKNCKLPSNKMSNKGKKQTSKPYINYKKDKKPKKVKNVHHRHKQRTKSR